MRYKKIGCFYLPNDIELHPFSYEAVFSELIVLRAESDFCRNKIKYYAACEQFKEIKKGEIIPEYIARFEAGSLTVIWEAEGE